MLNALYLFAWKGKKKENKEATFKVSLINMPGERSVLNKYAKAKCARACLLTVTGS